MSVVGPVSCQKPAALPELEQKKPVQQEASEKLGRIEQVAKEALKEVQAGSEDHSIGSLSSPKPAALPELEQKKPVQKETFEQHRARVVQVVKEALQAAKAGLEDLSLGWDFGAQCLRGAGVLLVQQTEQSQKERLTSAQDEADLLKKVLHIQVDTFPGLMKLVPDSKAFAPLKTKMNQEIPPKLERLIMEFHDKRAE